MPADDGDRSYLKDNKELSTRGILCLQLLPPPQSEAVAQLFGGALHAMAPGQQSPCVVREKAVSWCHHIPTGCKCGLHSQVTSQKRCYTAVQDGGRHDISCSIASEELVNAL